MDFRSGYLVFIEVCHSFTNFHILSHYLHMLSQSFRKLRENEIDSVVRVRNLAQIRSLARRNRIIGYTLRNSISRDMVFITLKIAPVALCFITSSTEFHARTPPPPCSSSREKQWGGGVLLTVQKTLHFYLKELSLYNTLTRHKSSLLRIIQYCFLIKKPN